MDTTKADTYGELALTAASAAIGVRKIAIDAGGSPDFADELAHQAMGALLEKVLDETAWGRPGVHVHAVPLSEMPAAVRARLLSSIETAIAGPEDRGAPKPPPSATRRTHGMESGGAGE